MWCTCNHSDCCLHQQNIWNMSLAPYWNLVWEMWTAVQRNLYIFFVYWQFIYQRISLCSVASFLYLDYKLVQLFSVVSPDVMVRTCGIVQCHIVYPYSRPDLKSRIHHWLVSRWHTTTGSFLCISSVTW
jgi:hypothetical protein